MKRENIFHIFQKIPTIETERLTLRPMCVGDAQDMFEYARRADVTKYLTWCPHPSLAYTKEYLSYVEGHYAAGDFFDWALVERECGRMIGTCGFTRFHYEYDCAEIGYVINPAFWGRGYATEAVNAVIRFGFQRLELNRIEARFIEGNAASRRVMEKSGMTYEGMGRQNAYIKGEYRNVGTCSILRRDYFSYGADIF